MTNVDAVVVGGGQCGLAAARELHRRGLRPVVLEAGAEPVGSWPRYYDSLTLFSPARYSALPGLTFPGDPDHYPHRDEVIDYLRRYATTLEADLRTHHRVTTVHHNGPRFAVHTDSGTTLSTALLIAATGAFGRPHRPDLPGLERFAGTVLHAADYREPSPFAGQRVLVVGGGNSAVQIAAELAAHARVTLTTRRPLRFVPQRPLGRDLHFWLNLTRLDRLPIGARVREPPTAPVFDTGIYRAAIANARPDWRPLFHHLDGHDARWADGHRESVDTIILATGYQPDLEFLRGLDTLSPTGRLQHRHGISTAHPGLGYLGLDWQRSPASASLRGAGRDARYLVRRLIATVGR